MGMKKPSSSTRTSFLFLLVLAATVDGKKASRHTRDAGRSMSPHFGMLSDHLASSSSVVSQLIKLKDSSSVISKRTLENDTEPFPENSISTNTSVSPPVTSSITEVEEKTTTEKTSEPAQSTVGENKENPLFSPLVGESRTTEDNNSPYHWRPAKRPPSSLNNDSPPEVKSYTPEPYFFICNDKKNCPIPGRLRPKHPNLPLHSSSTPPTVRKYGFRRVNKTSTGEKDEDEEYKTIYRSQIRKKKKKKKGNKRVRIHATKTNVNNFHNMSLEELQEFMRKTKKPVIKSTTPKSLVDFFKDMTEAGKKPGNEANREDRPLKKEESKDVNGSSLHPFDLMMKEIKKLHKNKMQKTKSQNTSINHRPMIPFVGEEDSNEDERNKNALKIMMNNLNSFLNVETTTTSRPTVFTVRPTYIPKTTTTKTPFVTSLSPFEIMVMRMKEQSTKTTPFTVRPTSTLAPNGQNLNAELANLGLSSLMKIMREGSFQNRPTSKSNLASLPELKTFDAVQTTTPSSQLNALLRLVDKKKLIPPSSLYSDTILSEEEESAEAQILGRPVRRPVQRYHYSEKPFVVLHTTPSTYNNYGVIRTTHSKLYDHPKTTPFTVRPTSTTEKHYPHHRYHFRTTTKPTTSSIPYQPYKKLSYRIPSTTPFTVWNVKSDRPSTTTQRPYEHDVELKDPFDFEGDAFMSQIIRNQNFISNSHDSKNDEALSKKSFEVDEDYSEINPFRVHPFESVKDEMENDDFKGITLMNYGHDDRPLAAPFMRDSSEEEYYDDFENYDLEELVSKLSHEKPQLNYDTEDRYYDGEYSGEQDEETLTPFEDYRGSLFKPKDKISPKSTFPEIPKFSSFDTPHKSFPTSTPTLQDFTSGVYDTPKVTFGDTSFKLNQGFPDRPDVVTVFRDLPDIKAPYPKFPSSNAQELNNNPPPPVPTTADFVSQYLKNPFGSDFIRMEIDHDRFKHNRTKPGSVHVPLMFKNYEVRPVPPSTSPAPIRHFHYPPKKVLPQKKDVRNHPKRRPSKLVPKVRLPSSSKSPMKTLLTDLKNFQHAMLNLPNAIQDLPSFMKGLVSNKASFAGRAFSDQEVKIEEDGNVEEEKEDSESPQEESK